MNELNDYYVELSQVIQVNTSSPERAVELALKIVNNPSLKTKVYTKEDYQALRMNDLNGG